MRYQIEAPLRNFTGEAAGVAFTSGTGGLDDTTDGGRAALAYFRRRGYGVAPAPEVDIATAVPQPSAPTTYDPAEHGVDDVLAYLAGADEGVARRVLDAEATGKNRTGITSKREAILAGKQGEQP